MIATLCLGLVLGAADAGWDGDVAPDDAVRFTARLPASAIRVGGTYTIEVEATANEGAGFRLTGRRTIPFLLQMKAPPSISLEAGRVPRGEHLRPPYEAAVTDGRRSIEFRVVSAPKPDDALVINLIGYVERPSTGDAWLVRRRGRVAIRPGETLAPESAAHNDWQEDATLSLGDPAEPLKLPDKDGRLYDLSQHLGKKNVVLIMYRAFW